jgi:hypothetical protein
MDYAKIKDPGLPCTTRPMLWYLKFLYIVPAAGLIFHVIEFFLSSHMHTSSPSSSPSECGHVFHQFGSRGRRPRWLFAAEEEEEEEEEEGEICSRHWQVA